MSEEQSNQEKTYLDLLSEIIGEPIIVKFNRHVLPSSGAYPNGSYRFLTNNCDYPFASFTMVEMPGCCGVVIATGTGVRPNFQGKGIGKILHAMQLDLATMLGYTTLLGSDKANNMREANILNKLEWKKFHSFVNRRTENLVHLLVRSTNKVAQRALGFNLADITKG